MSAKLFELISILQTQINLGKHVVFTSEQVRDLLLSLIDEVNLRTGKNPVIENLYYTNTQLINYLQSIAFADEELVLLSMSISAILETYEDSLLSDTDKRAKEIRQLLTQISKKQEILINKLNKKMEVMSS